jgi:hypothetical protein
MENVVSCSEDVDPNEHRPRALEVVEETVWERMKERMGIVEEDGRAELQ